MHADPERLMPVIAKDFYVVATEFGHTDHDLPIWACGGIVRVNRLEARRFGA